MDQIINATVVPMSNGIAWAAQNGVLLVLYAALWVALGAGIVFSQGSVDQAWEWIRSLPLLVQAVVWLLFLPVTAGIWVWESAWPLIVRVVLVVGLAGFNILVFLPKTTPEG